MNHMVINLCVKTPVVVVRVIEIVFIARRITIEKESKCGPQTGFNFSVLQMEWV